VTDQPSTPTPLDGLLARAVRKVKDPLVRRWFRALLASGEDSSDEGTEAGDAEGTGNQQKK
jgi:hypothetical protein